MADSRHLTGWGRTPRSRSELDRPERTQSISIEPHPRGNLARGLGRSYGDAAMNAGGVVWDTTGLTELEVDAQRGVARAAAGVSYRQILDATVPRGWFPPVTPGTKHVTVGGAVAADVHGKNHHRDGSLRQHVESITILTADEEHRTVRRGHELFEATFGGMGLTGIILEATIRLLPIPGSSLVVETVRTAGLDDTLRALVEGDRHHRYTVAWVDLASGGPAMGRGVVTAGDHAETASPSDWRASSALASVPPAIPGGMINRATVRGFNELWFRKAPRRRTAHETIESFFYPLDALAGWNRLYGPAGFLQYQFVVPEGAEAQMVRIIELLRSSGAPLALAVLKRFGPGAGLLSFPAPGWTLAVDIPARKNELATALDRADWIVAESGGRVYLAKDSRMRAEPFQGMYPEIDKWRTIANRYDPELRFRSDLDRRLQVRADI